METLALEFQTFWQNFAEPLLFLVFDLAPNCNDSRAKQKKWTNDPTFSFTLSFHDVPPWQDAKFILVSKIYTLTKFQKNQQVVLKSRYPKLLNEP